jgi:hypothetical protein
MMRRKLYLLFFLLSFILMGLSLYFTFFRSEDNFKSYLAVNEKYDTTLNRISTIRELDIIIDQYFKKYDDTAKVVLAIDDLIKRRFYQGYSKYTLNHNWVAVLCAAVFWDDFYYPVLPNDILKFPNAACSQQGIIFQNQLQRLQIPYETIALKQKINNSTFGHYTVSVFYDKKWHFFDTSEEPIIIDSTMPNIESIIERKLYEKMYVRASNIETQSFFKTNSYTKINRNVFSAHKMSMFHRISSFLSKWLWLILLLFNSLFFFRNKQ